MHADFVVPVRQLAHREGIVDFRRRRVVDRERADVGLRQIGHGRRRAVGRKRDPLGERLRQERVVVVVVRRGYGAARGEQRHRILLRRVARRGERLPLDRVLVRPVEQHVELRAEGVGQAARAELVRSRRPSAQPRASCARPRRARRRAPAAAHGDTCPCLACRRTSARPRAPSRPPRPRPAPAHGRNIRARGR